MTSKTDKAKKSAATKTKNKKKDICFTIMPFGGWGDEYYETIYCPAIRGAGLEPHRADDLFRPSTIVNDIWAYTKRAKLLVADLTGKNPNVFYELGLAHALAKPAILVAECMDEIPFDLRALRIIVYNKNAPDWGQLLGDKIEAAIKEVLKSPVEAVLPAFLDVKPSADKPVVTPHEKEMIEIKQELDLLRREMRTHRPSVEVVEAPTLRSRQDFVSILKNYLTMGMPREMIIDRMTRYGVSRTTVERELSLLRKKQYIKQLRTETAKQREDQTQQ